MVILLGLIATLAYDTAPKGIHNLGLLNEKLCLVVFESALLVIIAISLAAAGIVAAINSPREEAAAARRKQESVQRKTAETLRSNEDREEREMIAEIKLGELMNPKLPEIKKPPRETDFDSIIAGEIAGQTPQRAAPPPRRSRPG